MRPLRLLAPVCLALALFAQPARAGGWLHVKVDEGPGGDHVNLKVPVWLIARFADDFDDEPADGLRIDDEEISAEQLRRAWQALADQPDATLLSVREGDSDVTVTKQGGSLLFRVTGDERVDMEIPGEVIDALLAGDGDRLNMGAAMRAMARHGKGTLTVYDGDETVEIWVGGFWQRRPQRGR